MCISSLFDQCWVMFVFEGRVGIWWISIRAVFWSTNFWWKMKLKDELSSRGDLLVSGWSPRACIVGPLACSFALMVLLCIALSLCLWFTSFHPLLFHGTPLCPVKYTRILYARCQEEMTDERLPWLSPFFVFCPHLLTHSQLATTLHMGYCFSSSYPAINLP